MEKKLFIIFVFFIFSNGFGQEYIQYTTDQGLPSNTVYCIRQDANGFMWFATNRGIAKYDGAKFTSFTVKDGLPNNDIWRLEPDNKGRIWYMSKSKYQGYIENDSVYKFITEDSLVISPNTIFNDGYEVFLGNYVLNKTRLSKIPIENLSSTTDTSLFQKIVLHPKTKEQLIISENTLKIRTKNSNVLFNIPIDDQKKDEIKLQLSNLGSIANGYSFVSFNKGILLLNIAKKKGRYYSFMNLVGKEIILKTQISILNDGIQLSIPNFLLIFDETLALKSIFKHKNNKTVHSYIDKDGNIWGTNSNMGVFLIPQVVLQSTYYLKNNKISKINGLDTSIYIGIDADGFYEFNTLNDTFIKRNEFNTNGLIYQIKYNAIAKNKYFVSHTKINIKAAKNLTTPFLLNKQLGYKDILDFNGVRYIATSSHLILKNNTDTIDIPVLGLSNLQVFKQKIYAGGNDGLQLIENDQLHRPLPKNELLNLPITAMLTTEPCLIIGTDGRGIYFFNEYPINVKSTDGLIIQRIIKKENTLWLATQNGVKVLTIDTKNPANSIITNAFYKADGLLQNNVNDIYITGNYLYACADIGLAKINLKNPIYTVTPKLYFETASDTIVYKYNQNKYAFTHFSVQNYVNQNNLTFETRLLPLRKTWNITTNGTENLSNLPPDFYTLEVRVTDQHGNQTIKKQYISVLPAWWQTDISKVFFVLFAILFFGLIFKLIHAYFSKKEKRKSEQIKRVANLELQALRAQMNPHFIHNSLNAIQYYIENNEVAVYQSYLSKFSKLIQRFFEYSRSKDTSIRNELDLLTNYLEIEKLRFDEKFDFKIIIDEKLDLDERFLPAMLLQPIVENAVNHGLFHSKNKGLLSLEFIYTSTNCFSVIIKDNGIGINKGKQHHKNYINNKRTHSSAILKERLDLLKQGNDWQIEYEIKDISDYEDASGTFVQFIFTQL